MCVFPRANASSIFPGALNFSHFFIFSQCELIAGALRFLLLFAIALLLRCASAASMTPLDAIIPATKGNEIALITRLAPLRSITSNIREYLIFYGLRH
ncbi:hypothetical protein GGR58DRAFT_477528 [Xylaria digitata]|nr:hypothetical protein GGR58DRAFT_477528 [Xylaria digitata]